MISAVIKLLLGATAIGFAPIFAKLLIVDGGIGPFASGFWRMFIGSVGFFVMLLGGQKRKQNAIDLKGLLRTALGAVLLAGILFAADLMAWHTSFLYTSVGASSLIANLSAVFVPLTGILLFKEKLRPNIIFGGLLAFVGFTGLTFLKAANGSSGGVAVSSNYLGEWLAFLTAFFYTGYILSIKSMAGKYSSRVIMLVSSAVSAVILGLVSIGLNQKVIPTTAQGWLWAACVGLVSQVLGQGLVASALATLPAGQSALLLLWAPISSALFGWLILNESLNIGQILSMALTVLGIAIVARSAVER